MLNKCWLNVWMILCLCSSFILIWCDSECVFCLCNKEVFNCFMSHEWMKKTDIDWVLIWSQASCWACLLWMWPHFNFLSLQILFTYFPNLILSNKSPGYHSGALFGVSLPLFRPKQKAVCSDFWLPQSLDLNEEKWRARLLVPVLCLLKLVCICVRQRDGGIEQLLPTKPPSGWWSPGHQHQGQKSTVRAESTGHVGTISLSFLLSVLNRFLML